MVYGQLIVPVADALFMLEHPKWVMHCGFPNDDHQIAGDYTEV